MTTTDDHETPTVRRPAKPFGADKAHALMIREEALRTLTRQEAFDRGYITVKDLDDEELRYGRCRDRAGHIPPKGKNVMPMVTQDQYDSMVAEHEKRFKERMRQQLDTMLDVMIEVATDDTVEPRDRFEAAKYLFERVAGKAPETVNVTVKQAPWEGVLKDISGIGAISRAEHRRLTAEGDNAGIIDVEYEDEIPTDQAANDLQPNHLQETGEGTAEQNVVPVHQPRPEQPADIPDQTSEVPPSTGQHGVRKYVDGEPAFDRDPAKPTQAQEHVPVEVDEPDPVTQYGSKRTEAKGYAEQAREAQALAQRRKDARTRIQQAKKQRKIDRATGADAIKDEITGATVGEDGKLTFE